MDMDLKEKLQHIANAFNNGVLTEMEAAEKIVRLLCVQKIKSDLFAEKMEIDRNDRVVVRYKVGAVK